METVSSGNLLANIPAQLSMELSDRLLSGKNVRIERIVSKGHCSPPGFWYDQCEHEWVLLITGGARLQFEQGEVHLAPGDYLDIPAHLRHRVAWTQPGIDTVWLAVFY